MAGWFARKVESFTYNHRQYGIIDNAMRPIKGDEAKNFQISRLRGAQRRVVELKEAFSTPRAGISGWIAPGAPVATEAALRFIFHVPEVIRIPVDQGVRLAFAGLQKVAYKKDNTRDQIKELQTLEEAKAANDLMLSGEFRLAMQLRYLERFHPEEAKRNGGLEQVIRDNPDLLEFARGKLDEVYDKLNEDLKGHHRRRDRRRIALGDSNHPILTTHAVVHEDLEGIQPKFDEFFDGPNGAVEGEGGKKIRPVHEAILDGLKQDENKHLRLDALQGAATAASNFLQTLRGSINRRISANRWSEVVNGAQIVFGWVASTFFYGGLLPTWVVASAQAPAILTALGISTAFAPAIPLAVAAVIVGATLLSTSAGVSRIINKMKRNSFARNIKRSLKDYARKELETMRDIMDGVEVAS